jgi:hypothetical protein
MAMTITGRTMGVPFHQFTAPKHPRPPSKETAMSSGAPRLSKEDLRSVATYQKVILICILAYLAAAVGRLALPPALQLLTLLGLMAVVIVATVFVFMLAIKIYNVGLGIAFGILTVIPCIGLIVLLVINQKATSVLKAHGYKVGLLGADLSSQPKESGPGRGGPG